MRGLIMHLSTGLCTEVQPLSAASSNTTVSWCSAVSAVKLLTSVSQLFQGWKGQKCKHRLMVAECPSPKASPPLFSSVVRFTSDMEFLTYKGKSCHVAFGLPTLDPLFLLNTLILSATLVPGCCWVFWRVWFWFFFFISEQEPVTIWLEGRKLQLTRILKPELTLTVCQAAERMWPNISFFS